MTDHTLPFQRSVNVLIGLRLCPTSTMPTAMQLIELTHDTSCNTFVFVVAADADAMVDPLTAALTTIANTARGARRDVVRRRPREVVSTSSR